MNWGGGRLWNIELFQRHNGKKKHIRWQSYIEFIKYCPKLEYEVKGLQDYYLEVKNRFPAMVVFTSWKYLVI